MKQQIADAVRQAVKKLFDVDVEPELTRPDEQFGDYATNVAMQLAGRLGQNPREIAEQLANELADDELLGAVTVAGPGFLNLKLSDQTLWQGVVQEPTKPLSGQEILVEFGD